MSVIFVEFITAVGSRRDLHNFLADDMGPTNQLTLQASCSLLYNVTENCFNSHWNYHQGLALTREKLAGSLDGVGNIFSEKF